MSNFNSSILLICAFLYSIFMSFTQVEFLQLAPIFFAIYCEYKNIGIILKKLLFLNLFILMIFFVLLLQSSLEEALNIYLRTNMIILFNLLLFSHSNGYDVVRALDELKFPKSLVSAVYFTLKMIQVLSDEFRKIRLILRARGFTGKSTLFTYETYGNLFGHIFVKSIKKANAMEDSFKLRGFNGKIYLISNSKISIYDIVLIFLVSIPIVKKVLV